MIHFFYKMFYKKQLKGIPDYIYGPLLAQLVEHSTVVVK